MPIDNITIREYYHKDWNGLKGLAMSAPTVNDLRLIESSMKVLKEYNPPVLSFVAEANGLIIGFNFGYILPNGLLIPEGMYVDPDYRRKGTAKSLSEALESVSKCQVSMAYYNKDLSDYYARLGYDTGRDIIVGIKPL